MTPEVAITKAELKKCLESISGLPILVVGDLMLDRYIWGVVERISQEAPVPVVQVRKTEDRMGGAGNVVRNLLEIGADVTVAGFVGEDEEGWLLKNMMEFAHIKVDGLQFDPQRPTTIKTRVIAHNQQVVRIDREVLRDDLERGSTEGDKKLLRFLEHGITNYRAIIISDYGKGAIGREVMSFVAAARSDKRLGLGTRPVIVDPHPSNYGIYRGMNIAKPNRKEAEAGSGIRIKDRESAREAAKILRERWQSDMILISLGEAGLMISGEGVGEDIFLDTVARSVFDVSGAGDTVTAVFSAAIASGATPRLAGTLANIAAGIVVSEVGTVPIRRDALLREIDHMSV